MTSFTMAQSRKSDWFTSALLVIGTSFVITLFGYLSIPLPFSPVPLATQASFCLMLPFLIGRRRATLAVLLFLAEGAMGLPVFSLGKSGFLHLLSPTGGYLIGALLGTYLTGKLYEITKEKGAKMAFFSMAAGNALIFLCGWSHLSLYLGAKSAFMLGVLPFLLGDLFKLLIATQTVKISKRL
jgi:biotin transport system substrate-specific component